jgi:type II secretory pathway component GspD/PulD (secretin)
MRLGLAKLTMRSAMLIALATWFLLASLEVSAAQTVPSDHILDEKRIQLRFVQQDLQSAIATIAKVSGVPYVVEREFSVTVSNLSVSGTVREVLNQLASKVRAIWWYDNHQIHFISAEHFITKSIPFPYPLEILIDAARRLNLPIKTVTLDQDATSQTIKITGSQEIVNSMKSLAVNLGKRYGTVRVVTYGRMSYKSLK